MKTLKTVFVGLLFVLPALSQTAPSVPQTPAAVLQERGQALQRISSLLYDRLENNSDFKEYVQIQGQLQQTNAQYQKALADEQQAAAQKSAEASKSTTLSTPVVPHLPAKPVIPKTPQK